MDTNDVHYTFALIVNNLNNRNWGNLRRYLAQFGDHTIFDGVRIWTLDESPKKPLHYKLRMGSSTIYFERMNRKLGLNIHEVNNNLNFRFILEPNMIERKGNTNTYVIKPFNHHEIGLELL